MAIKLVTGVPGSGKSYYAVHHILTKHFEWNEDLDEYENKGKVVIITDIDGLRLDHYSLDYMLKKYSVSLEEFFTVPFQEKLSKEFGEYHIVYLLDEIQRRFPAGYRNTEVLFYFQWHRHLGHDLYLMAQTSESVCKHIVALIEFEIKAVRESVKLGKVFKYYFMAGDLKVDEKTIVHNKKVFGLYTSFKKDDQGDTPKPLKKLIIRTGIILLCMVCLCYCSYRGIRKSISSNLKSSQGQTKFTKPPLAKRLKQIAAKPVQAATTPRAISGRKADDRPVSAGAPKQIVEDLQQENLHLVQCGGLWVGQKLVAVQLWGRLIQVRDLPYAVAEQVPGSRVNVLVPGEVLAQAKPILPAGGSQLYRGLDERLYSVGQRGDASSSSIHDGADEDPNHSAISMPKNGKYYTTK